MTIAVGLYGTNGIVLCTDSQFTVPQYMKYSGHKIFTIPGQGWAVGLAYAGDPERAQHIYDRIKSDLLGRNKIDKKGVQKSLEEALASARSSIVNSYESIDVVCGFSTKNSLAMFSGKSGVVVEKDEIVLLGMGDSSLARYLESLFDARVLLSSASAAILGAYLVQQAIQFVDTCGGDVQMTILQDGEVHYIHHSSSAYIASANTLHDILKHSILHSLKADMEEETPRSSLIREMDDLRKTIDALHWKF